MSKVVTTTVLPDVAGGSVTLGGTGDSVVATGNDIRTNALQDAGGNAVFTSNGSGVMSGMNSAFAGAMKLIQTQTVSNQASVSFTTGLDNTYDVYIFKFYDVNPVTDSVELTFNASTDGGSNYNVLKTTTVFKSYHTEAGDETSLSYQPDWDLAQSANAQDIMKDMGNGADECGAGELYLFAPSSTTFVKHFYTTTQSYHKDDASLELFVAGYLNTTSAVDAVQFKMSSGNMDAVIKLYGISKS